MKKTLVGLFTLVALAVGTQSFAACCNSCNSCTSNFYYPKTVAACPCVTPCAQPCAVALPCITGAACPVSSCCNSCNSCNNCCREKCSWWKIFQNKNCCYKCNKCCDCCD